MKAKRALITLAAGVLAGALMIGGTMAYLSDTETATNTFTVGNVDVELKEPDYPGNDDEKVKNQVPNQETDKNPQVTNTGANDAVVFLTISVPVKTITPVTDDGKKGTKGASELFTFKLKSDNAAVHDNHFSGKWVELPAKETGTDLKGTTRTYVFGYKTAVAPKATTEALFDKIQLKNFLEAEITPGQPLDIDIKAYAIQADNIVSGGSALNTDGDLSADTLGKIYDAYVAQNSSGN